jgi:pimeloyl-ACP methyl ester carboxylesterase
MPRIRANGLELEYDSFGDRDVGLSTKLDHAGVPDVPALLQRAGSGELSSTGNPELPPASPEAMAVLLAPPPASREEAIESGLKAWQVIGSPGFPLEEDRIRERAGRAYDRSFHPAGAARQLAAILAHGSRKPRLAAVSAPTLVIHGSADPLVPLEGGRDTAEAIPGADLVVIEGMGHDLPAGAWPRIVDANAAHTAGAEDPERG